MRLTGTLLFLFVAVVGNAAELKVEAHPGAALHAAIREGDMARVQTLLAAGAEANSVDTEGMPALVNAALWGDARIVRALLDRGANPNAAGPVGTTALIAGAGDLEKARLLIAAGADVNAQSKLGRTPLLVAASVSGGAPIVKLLLDKGAKADVRDNLDGPPVLFTGGGQGTPLVEAARSGDLATVQMLLAAGLDPNTPASRNITALSEAVLYGRRELVRELLARRASVQSTVTRYEYPLLAMAAIGGDVAIARMLIQAGAAVNRADTQGVTPLMWAAASDAPRVELVRTLLAAGADAKARNKAGESARDWALRRGETKVSRMLAEAGAPRSTASAASVPAKVAGADVTAAETLRLMLSSADVSFKTSGCATCHHHTLTLIAAAAAQRKGIAVPKEGVDKAMGQMMAMMKPMYPVLLEGSDVVPDATVSLGYIAEALAAHQVPVSPLTAAATHNVMLKQQADGRWVGWAPRAPLEGGDIQATALAIRTMRLYPIAGRQGEITRRVAMAGKWLRRARPATTEDRIMRMMGLEWSGIDENETRDAMRELIATQRREGGWSQLPSLNADAYATAKATASLQQVYRAHPGWQADMFAVQRGLAWLAKHRLAGGTWQVTTRAFPFQPLKDSGFPHGRDQWISAAATGWATLALVEAGPSATQAKTKRPTRRPSVAD